MGRKKMLILSVLSLLLCSAPAAAVVAIAVAGNIVAFVVAVVIAVADQYYSLDPKPSLNIMASILRPLRWMIREQRSRGIRSP